MKMKKLLALVLSVVMVLGLLPAISFADGTATVTVTIVDQNGAVVLPMADVTVTDANGNSALDVDDALRAAHVAAHPNGADGYGSTIEGYPCVTKLWGYETYSVSFYLNNTFPSLTDTVSNGDYIVAYVGRSPTWDDAYSFFDQWKYEAETGTALTVGLKYQSGTDSSWQPVFDNLTGASITAYAENGTALAADKYTVSETGSGAYCVTFTEAGCYKLIARVNDSYIVPAVCAVTVTGGSTPTEPEQNDTKVSVTIVNENGAVVLPMVDVTVTDANGNSALDVDDALRAAHVAAHPNGADGYASTIEVYPCVTKLWGYETYSVSFYLNNTFPSLTDTVSNGDYIVAYVGRSPTWDDAYSFFDQWKYEAETGTALTVGLKYQSGTDSSWQPVFDNLTGASITAYAENGTALTSGFSWSETGSGAYSVTFAEAGSYKLIAKVNGSYIVPAVCAVTVTDSSSTPTEPGTVTGITLDKKIDCIQIGGSATLTATVTPETATDSVTWTSSDDDIASVSNGIVTGVAAGTVTITATAGGKSATCAVTVVPEGVRILKDCGVVITYTAPSDASNGTISEIGTAYQTVGEYSGKLYLASLPYGAVIQSLSFANPSFVHTINSTETTESVENTISNLWFLTDGGFKNTSHSNINNLVLNCITSGADKIPTEYVKGFYVRNIDLEAHSLDIVCIQISTSSGETITEEDKLPLANLLATVADGNENYYSENDRWNGKTYDSNGHWNTFIAADGPRAAAQYELEHPRGKEELNTAYQTLQDAVAVLIPAGQANTTPIYDAIVAEWYWTSSIHEKVPKKWTEGNVVSDSLWVNEETATAASWMPYAAALSDAQELYGTLFDENGNATAANAASLNGQIATLAALVDVSKLVNKENYTQRYNYFQAHKSEAEGLLAQSDPSKLTQNDYTAASWSALTTAWNALDADLKYRIVGGGGSRSDMDMLVGFSGHYDALLSAYQGLVSDTDITVDFTYVNNFAAKYPDLRSQGQDVYRRENMPLSKGHTTVQDAVTGASILFDSRDIRGHVIPGDGDNKSDTNPVYLVYVNDRYMGNNGQAIQLHQGDDVCVVRICQPVYVTEVSTGQSSSSNLENPTLDAAWLGDSLAMISMTAPTSPKVGDKAQFSAAVAGAYGTNAGKPFSSADITLFVSEPYSDETGHYSHQPTVNTGVTTDASGKLEYVFTEPGWYAVAMFNVEDDTPTFTDIFNTTTYGTYPSVCAGDFTFVYLAPADDEAALIAQYKAEYAATAKTYYDGFHDYDFAENYYKNTFKPQYDALVAHLDSATTFKGLQTQFNEDFATLKEYGAMAIDHQGAVDALRQNMSYLPDDLSTLNSGNATLVTEIQTAYKVMNAHTKSLLTPEELARLEAVAAVNVATLPAVAVVAVQIQTLGTLPDKSGNGNPYYGYPNLTWVKTPNLDGTVEYPVWANTGNSVGLSAKAGDHVFVRRYLDPTDEKYWMVWSVDGGTTWTPAVAQTLVTPDGSQTPYDGYYLVEYVVPQDVENGSTITLQLKMWSRAEYDANGIDATKAVALAAVQAAYDSYDLSKYDADGQAALLAALNKGISDINAATTNDAVAAARKAAVAAMKAVRKSGETHKDNHFDAGEAVGSVHVLIENTTYNGPFYRPNYGVIAEEDHVLSENDTMMTVVLQVLEENGFTWNGTIGNLGDGGEAADYTITYLASISKGGLSLGEFDGNAKSGWMGTLNDWFVSEGFEAFSVANGKLESGDEIHIMFTMDLGADIGGTWGNNNTALATMDVTGGKLTPDFDVGTTSYTLIVPAGGASVTLYPVPVNKNYQSRIFLNDYNKDAAMYKRTDLIAVKPGDVLYVGVGEKGWPTMNNGGKPTKYTIQVETADSAADKLDASKVKLSNYEEYASILAGIDRSSLSDAGKAKYDAVQARITYYEQIDNVKDLLAALPKSESASDEQVKAALTQIKEAEAAYLALTEEQQDYITVNDAANYNALVERLTALTPAEEQDKLPQTIVGGSGGGEKKEKKDEGGNTITAATVTVTPEVVDGAATAEVSVDDVNAALEETAGANVLTVKVDTEGAGTVAAALGADAVKAAAGAGVGLNVETENGTVKVDAGTLAEAAKGGKDVAVTVTENKDGTTTVGVTAGGKAVEADVKIELEAKDGQMLVVVGPDGAETPVILSATEDGTMYAKVPAGSTVKVVDAEGKDFGDVKATDWFAEAVEFVSSHGIFQGTGDGFEPGTTMNRAVLAMVLYRIDGAPGGGTSTFADVKPEDWFADAVAWAADAGIVNGRGEGFAPDAPVTREEIATMLYRFVQHLGVDVSSAANLSKFPDGGSTSPWAGDAMAWAVSVGLFKGDDTGALNPGGEATRAEVATLVERLIGLLVK